MTCKIFDSSTILQVGTQILVKLFFEKILHEFGFEHVDVVKVVIFIYFKRIVLNFLILNRKKYNSEEKTIAM